MRDLLKKLVKGLTQDKIVCKGCGWSWKLSEGGDDKYVCHKCGTDNNPESSNLKKVIRQFEKDFPIEHHEKLNLIVQFVERLINKSGYNVKYLKSCPGFAGVRTRDQIIICEPTSMSRLGDFIYTIFHEMRHESQISKLKMMNPLTDYDLEDFENLYKQYWEMELDADQFAKNMMAILVSELDIPIEVAKEHLSLSDFIKNYPSMSKMIESGLKNIISSIKDMKKRGEKYDDIQDLPLVQKHLKNLEKLI